MDDTKGRHRKDSISSLSSSTTIASTASEDHNMNKNELKRKAERKPIAVKKRMLEGNNKSSNSSSNSSLTSKGGVQPSNRDVLYGRGGRVNRHPGNIQYRKLVAQRKFEYNDCSLRCNQKSAIAGEIMYEWESRNGRFLEMQGGSWQEVEHPKVLERTMQALREKPAHEKRRRLKKDD